MEYKKFLDIYTKPTFGLLSHSGGEIEKMGDISRNDKIILIGDSHALMLKPFLNKIGKKNNFSFQTLTCDSYPAIEGISNKDIPTNYMKFYNFSRTLVGPTKKLINKNNIIILNINKFPPPIYKSVNNLAKTLNKNQKLILIKTFPVLTKNPLKNYPLLSFEAKQNLKLLKENNKNIDQLAKENPNIYVYDLSKSSIFKGQKAGYINDTITYYNQGHINTYGSLKLADDLEQDFMNFLNKVRNSK